MFIGYIINEQAISCDDTFRCTERMDFISQTLTAKGTFCGFLDGLFVNKYVHVSSSGKATEYF